ncbi:MAG: ATP-dependent DNA ligase [Pirellulales bacterium]
MKRFCQLVRDLEETSRTSVKLTLMRDYFATETPADAAWAVYFLSGRRLKRLIPQQRWRAWAAERAAVPAWLFQECYDVVGDLAETVALLLPPPQSPGDRSLSRWIDEVLLPMRTADEAEQKQTIFRAWDELEAADRLVLGKLITGGFRVGVSQSLVVRALAEQAGLPVAELAHRLTGDWQPTPEFFQSLSGAVPESVSPGRPYPFQLAHPLSDDLHELGSPTDWQLEWKWDGIRAQLIRRCGTTLIWSRGDESVGESFPELIAAAESLPDGTVLDGEILAWRDDRPLPFAQLQRRLGRRQVSARLRQDVPVVFLAFDLLEHAAIDIRSLPLAERSANLAAVAHHFPAPLRRSPLLSADDWSQVAELRRQARSQLAEGLMIKRRDAPYAVGRPRGNWWKWKVEPHAIDAVLLYAQPGHGRRANLYTDYTLAVWDGDQLVPVAKAYSGLTDAELAEVDRFIRSNTREKFGPVRSVTPELVFEIAFEGIQASPRHKSGVALRFPRIARWRRDKQAADADTLSALRQLIPPASADGASTP